MVQSTLSAGNALVDSMTALVKQLSIDECTRDEDRTRIQELETGETKLKANHAKALTALQDEISQLNDKHKEEAAAWDEQQKKNSADFAENLALAAQAPRLLPSPGYSPLAATCGSADDDMAVEIGPEEEASLTEQLDRRGKAGDRCWSSACRRRAGRLNGQRGNCRPERSLRRRNQAIDHSRTGKTQTHVR
jgi:hypothetical protein